MRAVITGLPCSEYTVELLFDSWMRLCEFIKQRRTLPERLEEIDLWDVAGFSMRCWQSPPDDADALLIPLVMLHVLLVRAECHRTALTALITDIRRMREPEAPF
jgi:hypothetical protein